MRNEEENSIRMEKEARRVRNKIGKSLQTGSSRGKGLEAEENN